MPRRTMPSCSCGWLCSGTTAPGSNSIRLIMAPAPNSGLAVTRGPSSRRFSPSKRTNCGSAIGGLSPVLAEAPSEIPAFRPVGRERERALVGGCGLALAFEAPQQVGSSGVERDVLLEPFDPVDE